MEPVRLCNQMANDLMAYQLLHGRMVNHQSGILLCPTTYTPSHLGIAVGGAGVVAEWAAQAQCCKYAMLQLRYHFVPVGIETSGIFEPSASSLHQELGRYLKISSLEPTACNYIVFATETISSCPKSNVGCSFRYSVVLVMVKSSVIFLL